MQLLRCSTLLFLAALTACGGAGLGGSGLTFTGIDSRIDRITFSNGSGGSAGTFFVAPSATVPLQISAQGGRGSGNVIVADATFSWTATNVTTATAYPSNVNGIMHTCVAPPVGAPNPLVILLMGHVGGGPLVPYDGTQTQAVYALPAPGAPTSGGPYCALVTATHSGDNVQGNVVVVVSNAP